MYFVSHSVSVVVIVVVSVLWIPVIRSSGELYNYLQKVASYLQPPICAVYLMALFWPRFTEPAAFFALLGGLGLGLARFIWESTYPEVPTYLKPYLYKYI